MCSVNVTAMATTAAATTEAITVPPGMLRSIVVSVTVCLSVRISQKPRMVELHQIFVHHVDCGGGSVLFWRRCELATRYVHPVSWMPQSFHVIGPMARRAYATRQRFHVDIRSL